MEAICTCGLIKQSKVGTTVDDAGIERCNNCGKPVDFVPSSGSATRASAAPSPARPQVSAQDSARGTAMATLVGGCLALAVGVVGTVLAAPRTTLDAGTIESSGSIGLTAFFAVVAGVGQVLVLIGVIAIGVRLGVRWSGVRVDD